MDTKEKLDLLKTWQESYESLDKAFDIFESALGCSICESNFFDSAWRTFQNYTKMIAVLFENTSVKSLDAKEVEEWLCWYCYENDMGKKEMEAKASSWKKMKKINNLKILLKAIEE